MIVGEGSKRRQIGLKIPNGAHMRPSLRSSSPRPHEDSMRPSFRPAGHRPYGPIIWLLGGSLWILRVGVGLAEIVVSILLTSASTPIASSELVVTPRMFSNLFVSDRMLSSDGVSS
nr:hypothetical protein [Tanacetum cinerariifolium]